MAWFVTRLIPFLGSPLGLQEQRLIRSLRVKQRGRADGRRNYPGTHDKQPSEVEQRVAAAFENAANELRQAWVDRWRKGGAKIDAQAFSAREQDYATPVTEAKASMDENRLQMRDQMIRARIAERAAMRELNKFRRDNELSRDAKYPDVPLLAVAILFSLTIAESAVNANLFAQVSDWGLTGGLFYALGMSIPNVLGGALVGFFSIRAAMHVHWLGKSLGTLCTALGVGALLFYNFYLAHYRTLLASNPDAELGAAWPHLFSNPLGFLASRDAVILLFVGLGAMILAVWKGLDGFSDKYLGYASVDKKHKKAELAYERGRATYRNSTNAVVAAARADISKRIEGVDQKVQGIMTITRDTLHDLEVVQTAMQASSNACRAALNIYRHENVMVRTTPAPAFFEHYPAFDDKLPEVGGTDFVTRRDHILARASELHQAANTALEHLFEHTRRFMDGVEEDIRRAEAEADERIERNREDTTAGAIYRPGLAS
jgi:hypothetical protein